MTPNDPAQRRSAFRVRLPDPGWLTATIVNGDGDRIGALVVDLSRAGLGAQLSSGVTLATGERLQCRLEFEQLAVETEATVRHCRGEPGASRVGLEFTAVTPSIDSLLNRAVFRLQRYLLRRRHGRAGLLR